jgi:hypothetical protein
MEPSEEFRQAILEILRNANGELGNATQDFVGLTTGRHDLKQYPDQPIVELYAALWELVREGDRKLAASMQDFDAELLRFQAAQCSPEAFLQRCREAYEAAISDWGPWSRFAEILGETHASVGVSDVVYANVAKCWAPASREGEQPDNQKTMKACNERFRLSRLVEIVDPELIIQVGVCDALKESDFGGRYREVVNNNNRPASREQLRNTKTRVRERYRTRFP